MTEANLYARLVISFYGNPESASAEDDLVALMDELGDTAKADAPPGLEVRVQEA